MNWVTRAADGSIWSVDDLLRAAHATVESMYRAFFRDIPETKLLFNVEQMVQDGKAFDYSTIAPEMIEKSWVPSYCKA